jgi:hypothetical protein
MTAKQLWAGIKIDTADKSRADPLNHPVVIADMSDVSGLSA